MLALNQNLLDTAAPPIPEVQGWIEGYDGAAGPLIDLSQAVPGYPPPKGLLEKLAEAAGQIASASYGDIRGDEDLRQVFSAEQSRLFAAELTEEEVVITAGCNQAFFLTMMALAKAGDRVLLPEPWYFNHQMTLQMLGLEAVALPCKASDGFLPDLEEAKRAISSGVKALALISPNNPTGAIYPPELLLELYRLCRQAGVWMVLDETYRDFLGSSYGPAHAIFQEPDWRDGLIQLYSFSKSYCLPGYRLGAITAGQPVLEEIGKVIDCLQICPARVGQRALVWAIPELRDWRADNLLEIERRAAAFRTFARELEGWRLTSLGAYFAYLEHPFSTARAAEVARKLTSERGVLCLPGSYFGAGQEGYLRVAFANADVPAIQALSPRFQDFSL